MDVPPRKLPPKKEVMIALLSESNVFVHLDPRRPGVIVPKWLQNAPELTLQLGLNMPIPIPDLEVEEDGISCTLSFNRAPFWCKLPWTAVFAIVSEKDRRGVVWPDDVPPESQLSNGGQKAPPPKARPKLTALGPNDRLEEREESPTSDVSETPVSGSRDEEERTPPPDAKCAECSTRWPEEQSTCPVCGATQWVGTGAPAIPPPPPPITRPTLVENNDPNAKKRTATRPRGKANARTPSPRVVGSRKRTRPELVSEPSGTLSEARRSEERGARGSSPSGKGASKDSADASNPNPTLALFPPPREETSAPPSPPKPTAAGERETIDTQTIDTQTGDTPEETGNKKPSKRPLPPYLRVVK